MDGQVGVRDARAEAPRRAPQAGERRDQGAQEGEHIVGATVRQLRFGAGPDAFVGVEFRRIGGEVREPQPRRPREERAHDRAAVNVAVVPDDNHRAVQMAEEIAEKRAGVGRADVFTVKLEIEPAPAPGGTERQPRDDRDAIVSLPVAQDRRLAPRRPRTAHGGDQEEARFVDEDEVGAQPRGVFFTRGHSRAFHRAMAASSRWSARRSGFCGVQPRACSRRPT